MASIAVLYIGERRYSDMTADNHQRFLDALTKKHTYTVYDVTHAYRTWSTQGLCGEQAQILDTHHALKMIKEEVVIKIRTDVWICAWEIDYLVTKIDQVVNHALDFLYVGPCVARDNEDREQTVVRENNEPRWVHDLMVIFRNNQVNDVEWLLEHFPEIDNYRWNHGWYMLAKKDAVCQILHRDVYVIRKKLDQPCHYQIVEDWYDQALLAVQGTKAFAHHLRLRDQWRSRYKVMTHENKILEQ
jgi:hypothetical protein